MGLFDADAGKAAKAMKKMWRVGRKDLEPYRKLGEWTMDPIKDVDITGGAGEFLNQLKNYGQNFQVNTQDPAYQWRLGEATKGVDQFLASRGMYNSRAGLNALQDTTNQLTAEESEKQYTRGYGQLLDSFNMASSLGQSEFSKLFNLLGVGAGAAGSSASNAIQAGGNIASSILGGGQAKTGLISDLMGIGGNLGFGKLFGLF